MRGLNSLSANTDDQAYSTGHAVATLPADSRSVGGGLPTGIVSFLLTDIQDSTRLWDTYPSEMRIATAQHDRIVEASVARHAGVVVRPRGEGDSRFAVFQRATDAVAAAVDIQLTLQREAWDLPEPLRVHLGLHSGEADLRDGDYYGSAVNRCARLRTLAHGGQILLSGAIFDLVQDAPDRWPNGTSPRLLGEYRLAGLARPERIFELSVEGVTAKFPPLAVRPDPPTNLPGQLTTFIGRGRELAQLEQRLLDIDVRLVTLIGPSGVGKTRLGMQVAEKVLRAFQDGVYFVSLASISRPELVPSAVAQALGIYESSARPVAERISAELQSKRLLLVLDNFEQVLDGATWVSSLLRACPWVKALVTSRSVLRVSGEHVFDVAPLSLPAADDAPSVLEGHESVQLFIDRARAASANFAPTRETICAVAEICRLSDGLPLAIELVAARARTMSVVALKRELARRRLSLLTGAPRDVPARHQTLRAAISWSYDQLNDTEQRLLRRLAVFVGGCTSEQAHHVCCLDGEPDDTDGALESLVDKSLLHARESGDGDTRYVMLETIREFAAEHLALTDEADAVREAHARLFHQLLQDVAAHRGGPHEAVWLRRLASEHDNLRAAMSWALGHGQIELALGIADLGWWFLLTYGFTHEGVEWLDQVLHRSAGEQSALRARILVGAGRLAHQLGDEVAARKWLEEALRTARSSADLHLLDLVLGGLSFVLIAHGDFERGLEVAEENVSVARQIGDQALIAHAHVRLAEHLVLHGDVERGAQVGNSAVQLTAGLGDGSHAAALDTLGLARRLSGSAAEAVVLLEGAVNLHREFGYKANQAEALFRLADALLVLGQADRAAALCREGLQLAHLARSRRRIATGLRVAAAVFNGRGDYQGGMRLASCAERLYGEFGEQMLPVYRADLEAVMLVAERELGPRRASEIRLAHVHDELADLVAYALNGLAEP
jgi:predicted ATPase/class 3 adenylate cyclase